MQWCWRIFVLFVAFLCEASLFAQNGSKPSDHLSFVRQFSSAEDVKRTHPIVEKTLDIVAGPKDDTETADLLQVPKAVASDAENRVFVLDTGERAVHVFDFARAKYSLLPVGDRLQSPVGIAADRDGDVYITDSTSRSVMVFDSKGKFRRELMKAHESESYFEQPTGIAIHSPSGHLYVCDGPRNMVIILDRRGRVFGRIGKRGGGNGPGELKNPAQIAVNNNEVVVLDAGNARLQVFDLQGRFRREIPLADMDAQSGLAIDSAGNVYVSDRNMGQIEVFSPEGQSVYRFGVMGDKREQFNEPTGLWVESGCLYVADTGNRRLQEFRIDGQSGSVCQ